MVDSVNRGGRGRPETTAEAPDAGTASAGGSSARGRGRLAKARALSVDASPATERSLPERRYSFRALVAAGIVGYTLGRLFSH